MMNKYDVIIVGAGIGGLVCGCYLSKAGIKVLVIDKNDRVGGCCVSFKRKGFNFDAGAHIIGSCGNGQILGNIFQELGICIDFTKFSPTDRVNFGDEHFDISDNIDELVEALKGKFNNERTGIDKFFKLISEAQNNIRATRLFKMYENATYRDILDEFFKDNTLKAILSFGCGYLGLPPSSLSGLSALFLLRSYLFDGAYYPKGGAQSMSDAFAKKITEYGGKVLLKNKVTKIICKNNMVVGVATESGDVFEAGYVVSNVDCRETFYQLIDQKEVGVDRQVMAKLEIYKNSLSFLFIFLGIKKHYDLTGKNGWYFSSYDIEKEFRNQIYLHIPTLVDPSVAPEGADIIEVGATFPYIFDAVKDWESIKSNITLEKLGELEKIIPGINNQIIYSESATPRTIHRYTLNNEGAAYGWRQDPLQVFQNAFPSKFKNPDGLFLAGHWTFPGGGVVSVAISGMNAAKKILSQNKCATINI